MMDIKETLEKLERQNYLSEKRYEILKAMICEIYDEVIPQKKICPVCKSKIRTYIPYGKPKMRLNAECPVCHSLERQRLLWRYLETNCNILAYEKNDQEGKMKVLHFAPEEGIYQRFVKMGGVDYYPVDINPDYPCRIVNTVDITSIPWPDNVFDLIVCMHVIANVDDEKEALKEMKRVLKPGACAIVNSAIDHNLEKTLEDARYNTPEQREKYYGNKEYRRRYGRDYIKRLQAGGWSSVRVHNAVEFNTAEEIEYYSLLKGEELYICQK